MMSLPGRKINKQKLLKQMLPDMKHIKGKGSGFI